MPHSRALLPAACVIPAAGFSSRMGRFKPTLLYHGEPLIAAVITTALQVCHAVVIVTGHYAAELRAAVAAAPSLRGTASGRLRFVANEHYLTGGMISSIACGARAVDSDWLFVAPADMPKLRAGFFYTLWDARVRADGGAPAPALSLAAPVASTASAALPVGLAPAPTAPVAPVVWFPRYGERSGHPVLVARAVAAAVPNPPTEPSMRAYLAHFPQVFVAIDDPAILIDIDTAADYQALD